MATIVAQAKSNAAPFVTFAAAEEAGDKVAHASRVKLLVHNRSAAPIILTIASEAASNEPAGTGPLAWTETIPAGQMAVLDLSNTNFKKTADGLVSWTYGDHEDVFIAAITL